MITDEQLAAWRALADKATPGPWLREGNAVRDRRLGLYIVEYECVDDDKADADLDLIATARTAMPLLLDEVERLRAEATDEIAKLRRSEADGWREAKEAQAEVAQLRAEAVDLSADLHAREERAMAAEAECERLRALLDRARPHVHADALDLEAYGNHEMAAVAAGVEGDIDAALAGKGG